MRALTLVLPFYRNLSMLAEQQRVWMDYPAALRAALHVIVVDDGSPKKQSPGQKQLFARGLGSLRLYRCGVDIRWNWLFARNLGVDQAKTDWVLLTDIDHVLPVETLRRLVEGHLDETAVYRLARVDAPHCWPYAIADCAVRESKRFHPNTWLLTRAMYDRIGGYDERLSGCYGTDGEFRDRVHAEAKAVVLLPDVLVRYSREVLPDASTTVFTRKGDPTNDDELLRRRQERACITGWRPLRLTFPWKAVASVRAEVPCSA